MTISEQTAAEILEELLAYSLEKLSMRDENLIFLRNVMLFYFRLPAPAKPVAKCTSSLEDILATLTVYCLERGICTEKDKSNFFADILGSLTPAPATISNDFDVIVDNKGVEAATTWFYNLCKNSNYINMAEIGRNIIWNFTGSKGRIVVTINLSKPEKDPKDVLAAKNADTGYPKCMLCAENVGFFGNAARPSRANLRTIPIILSHEPWHFQYSPYSYYKEHCIVFSAEHRPMKVDRASFSRLFDFVELFPHYFLGSNAALPIVGGSILAHDHYQGGAKVLPFFERGFEKTFPCEEPGVTVGIVDWYNSVVRVAGKDRRAVESAVGKIHECWLDYSDESVGIIARTTEPHNAVTPVARLEKDEYVFDLILRNNRTDKSHPMGIFHAAEKYHNIKKESIGIIEVMGIFILPGRLSKEAESICAILDGTVPYSAEALSDTANPISKHKGMIDELMGIEGGIMSHDKACDAITAYINRTCENILDNTAVFKKDEAGRAAFEQFINIALS